MTEDEMVGWYPRLDGHESEKTQGNGVGQRGLAWCSSWGHKESDTTEVTEHSHPYTTTGKTTALSRWIFVAK